MMGDMSKEANKMQVLTKIEKSMAALSDLSTQRGIDTARQWISRNKIDIETRLIEKLMDLVTNGSKDAFMSNVDRTRATMSIEIDPFIRDDSDPLS